MNITNTIDNFFNDVSLCLETYCPTDLNPETYNLEPCFQMPVRHDAWRDVRLKYGSSPDRTAFDTLHEFLEYVGKLGLTSFMRGSCSRRYVGLGCESSKYYLFVQIGHHTSHSEGPLREVFREAQLSLHLYLRARIFNLAKLNEWIQYKHFGRILTWSDDGAQGGYHVSLRLPELGSSFSGFGRSKKIAMTMMIRDFNEHQTKSWPLGSFVIDLLKLAGDIESNPGPIWIGFRPMPCKGKLVKHCCGKQQCNGCCVIEMCEKEDGLWFRFLLCQTVVYVPWFLLEVENDAGLNSLAKTTACYACRKNWFKAMRHVRREHIKDLTQEGIEPNPGPPRKGGKKGLNKKQGSDSTYNGRDRSKQHVYPAAHPVRDIKAQWSTQEMHNRLVYAFKTNEDYSGMLQEPGFIDHLKSEADDSEKFSRCAECFAIYANEMTQVCSCFRQMDIDETAEYMAAWFYADFCDRMAKERSSPVQTISSALDWSPPHSAPGSPIYSPREVGRCTYSPPARRPMTAAQRSQMEDSPVHLRRAGTPVVAKEEINPILLAKQAEEEQLKLTEARLDTLQKRISRKLQDALAEGEVKKGRAFSCIGELRRKLSLKKGAADVVKALEKGFKMPDIARDLIVQAAGEEARAAWQTCLNTFPKEWQFLLLIRPLIYLSGKVHGAFDLPPFCDSLTKAWGAVPPCVPQGTALTVIGWEGLLREKIAMGPQGSIPIIKPTMLSGWQEGVQRPRGRKVEYIVGPAPYSNNLGFFYDECWTAEHYQWLEEHDYRPTEIFGEFCLYKHYRVNTPSWWNIPARYFLAHMRKNIVMAGWWSFNDAAEVAGVVDTRSKVLFTNGASLHDGSYISAAQRLTSQKFSYVDYWSMVINGTCTYYGQNQADENLEFLQARVTDTDFRTFVSPWLSNFRVADRIYHSMFVDCQLKGTVNHPFNALSPAEKPALFGAEPSMGRDAAIDKMKDDVVIAVEPVSEPLAAAVGDAIDQGRKVGREAGNIMSTLPIACHFSSEYSDKLDRLTCSIMLDRQDIRGLGTHEEERNKSSAFLWANQHPTDITDLLNARLMKDDAIDIQAMSAPYIQQQCTWAVQDGEKVSIYDLPKYDDTRIKIEVLRDFTDELYSRARPERMYWVHFGDLYVPSPHSAVWTVGFRCGKSLQTSEDATLNEEKDAAFTVFCENLFNHWDIQYQPQSLGLDSVTLAQFMATVENMPAMQRRKRLEWFVSYMLGNKNNAAKAMKFFTKADESLFAEKFDPLQAFTPSGKPRSIFNASDSTFSRTQPELTLLKQQVKLKDANNIMVEGYEIEMPQVLHHDFIAKGVHYHVHLRYMADSDNVQDAAWMTEAWFNGAPNHIYIEVGGDDNNTIMWFKGHRFEIEGDLSMCDQSMRGVYMHVFLKFLRKAGMAKEIVDAIKETYMADAHYIIKGERIILVKFLEEQLKTGVAHTSFSNTFIVGLLMIWGLQRMLESDIAPDCLTMKTWLEQEWLSMGIAMKLKIYKDAKSPLSTFHKRYFVFTKSGTAFSACALPSAIVKMCCVKCPSLMNRKTFLKRLQESAKSRSGMSSNPLMRAMCDLLGAKVERVETDRGVMFNLFNFGSTEYYGGSINLTQWAAVEGDGSLDDHLWFMRERYNMDYAEYEICLEAIKSLSPTQCYLVSNSTFGLIMWRMFKIDYG